MLEDRIKGFGVVRVALACGVLLGTLFAAIDRPAELRHIRLLPPAVALGEVEAAIDENLHAAGAAGLPRPPRRVDPDIHTLHQLLGKRDVVIFEKDDMAAEFGALREFDPFADEFLALLVRRMRLAGKDELDGSRRIIQQTRQPRRIGEQQIRPLVTGEAPRKAKRQRVRVEHIRRFRDVFGRVAAAGELPGQPAADGLDQTLAAPRPPSPIILHR